MPEAHLLLEGRVLSLFADPTLALTYRADVALDRAVNWWRPDHQLDGDVSLTGTVAGPIAAPRVTAELDAPGFRWADLSEIVVRGDVEFDDGVVALDKVAVAYGAARLDASGRVTFGDTPTPSSLKVSWQDLDSAELLRQLDLELPYVPGGIVSGDGTITWTEWDPRSFQLATQMTSRAHADQVGVIPFGGTARFEASSGRWTAELDDIVVPGLRLTGHVGGSLAASDRPLTDARLEGTIIADAADLAQIARVFSLPGLAGDAAGPGLSGVATAEVTLAGTLTSPIATGRIADTQIGFRGIKGIGVRSIFTANRRRVALDELTATLGPNVVTGTVHLDLSADSVDGLLDAELADLSILAPVLPAAIAPTGRLDGQVVVSGRLGAPHVDGELVGDQMTFAGRALDRVAAHVSLDEGILRLESFEASEASQDTGRVTLRGSYVQADGTYELDLNARELSLASLAAATTDESSLHGQLNVDVTSRGSPANPMASGTARIDALEWAGRSLGTADITLAVHEGALRVNTDIPSLNATGIGRVGLVDDTMFDLTVELLQTPFDRLLGPATGETERLDVTGVGSLRVTATGDRSAVVDSRVTLELLKFDGFIGATHFWLSDPGIVRYAERTLAAKELVVRLDDTRVTLSGSLTGTKTSEIAATLAGELSDLAPLVELALAEAGEIPLEDLSGRIDTQLLLTGSSDEPDLSMQLRIRDGTVATGSFEPAHDLDIDLNYDKQTVRLKRLAGTWQGTSIDGSGELPVAILGDMVPEWLVRQPATPSPARLTLTADNITLDTLAAFIDQASLGDLAARASARLDVEADGLEIEQVRAGLRLSQLDLTVAGIPVAQRRETQIDITDGRLHVRALDWGNEDDYLTVGGTVDLSGDTAIDLTITDLTRRGRPARRLCIHDRDLDRGERPPDCERSGVT